MYNVINVGDGDIMLGTAHKGRGRQTRTGPHYWASEELQTRQEPMGRTSWVCK